MRSLFAMILAMMVAMPAVSTAQQEQSALRRVHVMTGAGTLPRNPANRLEYLRYATTGEPRLTGKQLAAAKERWSFSTTKSTPRAT
jgi:hypothetical protein